MSRPDPDPLSRIASDLGATTTEPAGGDSDPADEGPLLDLLERWEERYRAGDDPALESLCGPGHPLVDRLRSMIARQKRLYARLGLAETPADGDGGVEPSPPTFPGHEILAEIGRGGMGVVYKALDLELGRPVAIKVMIEGRYATPEQRGRFRSEAQAAARLRHPNIIAIDAVGEHEGRPFLLLEYADGGNLARRLAEKPMAPREAAELLETLARAVHAAHQAGVVHRDLKPSNVLLTADGVPKIGDFGLAKLLDAGSERTASDQVMGSPSYMSPEQASGHSKRVGPAADTYALGAILYQALTGRPPFLGESAMETIRMVTSTEAVPPRRLRPEVPRDLETICLRCLEKEPLKRYPDALALADDLRRFLDGRPIAARPVGPAGRSWRWARRNPWVAGLSAGVFASLVIGTVVSSSLAFRAIRAEAATRDQRDRAEVEARRFRAVNDFLRKDLLGLASVDQQAALGAPPDRELKVRTALDRAAEKIGERCADQPLIEASIRQTIGQSYLELGLFSQAGPHLERALELRRTILGPDDPETFSAMASLGGWLASGGRVPEALEKLVAAMEGLRKTRGPDDLEMLSTTLVVGQLYGELGKEEALTLLSVAREGFRRIRGPQDEKTIDATLSLAEFHLARNRPREAERLMEESVEGLEDEFGGDHPGTLGATRCLAFIYSKTGKPEESERRWRMALRGQKQALGDLHPHTLGTMVLFGDFLMGRHEESEAERIFLEVIEGGRKSLDRNHIATTIALGRLAGLHLRKREWNEAEKYLIESVEMTRSRMGLDSEVTAQGNLDAGLLLLIEGKYARAEPYLRDCRNYWVRYHPERGERWRSELLLGICLLAQRQDTEASSRLLSFYNAMKPGGKGRAIKGEEDLAWLVEQIIRLRDEDGRLGGEPSLARLSADPHIRAIVVDLLFRTRPFAPPRSVIDGDRFP